MSINKLIKLLIILYIFTGISEAGIFDIFSNKHRELKDSINKEFSDIKAELGVIKDNQICIKTKIESQIKARATIGYDKSSNQDTRAGRDVTITNDTGFLKLVIGALGSVIIALILAIILLMKMMFRYFKEKKDYKRRYYEIKNGGEKNDHV